MTCAKNVPFYWNIVARWKGLAGWDFILKRPTGNLDQNFSFLHTIMPQDLQFLVIPQLAITEEPSIFRLPDAADIQKVSLIRLSTFTHGFNSELQIYLASDTKQGFQ